MSRHRADLREVEQSPDGRYVRFDEKLGNGAYKEVYLAYDQETGKEVAWNTVEMRRLPSAEKRRIRSETEILAELQHPHIINFYHVWENKEKDQICFTTEIVTSGTLKQYTNRVKGIKLKVIKKWCRQILTALDYLHSHDPPIIHRDLKCDNIFINGGTGEIRLGDFGLSAHRTCTHVASVLGTPEFMAPELYEENYSESVDIYAFGMCVLEMTSKEYPYEECSNAAQIWKKVTGGLKPDVLARVHDPQVRAFIELCICPSEHRLSAPELLAHPFLSFRKSDSFSRDNMIVTVEPKSKPTTRPHTPDPPPPPITQGRKPKDNEPPVEPPVPVEAPATPMVNAVVVEIESASGPTANIVLHIHLDNGRRKKQIKFALDFRHDTSMSLAGEMVQSLKLPDAQRTQMLIASAMEAKIEPVRQHYFAYMAGNPISPSSGMEMDEASMMDHVQQQSPPQQPNVFQHTSYTTSTPNPVNTPNTPGNGTTPNFPQAAGSRSVYTPTPTVRQPSATDRTVPAVANPQSQQPALKPKPAPGPVKAAPGAAPSVSPLPPYPTNPSTTAARPPPQPTMQRNPSKEAPSDAPNRPPTPSSRPGTANSNHPTQSTNPPHPGLQRPNTTTPQVNGPPTGTRISSLPTQFPDSNPSTNKESQQQSQLHKHSMSDHQLGGDKDNGPPPPLPPQSPPHGAMGGNRLNTHHSYVAEPSGHAAGLTDQLLTLDAFNSSEEYEAYLASEFKSLSVAALKERLRNKPGGTELVKACFEKHDLIQMLIRVTVQEGCSGEKTLSRQNTPSGLHSTSQHTSHHVPPQPHQSFSGSPDFLSPEPSTGSSSSLHATSPKSPPFSSQPHPPSHQPSNLLTSPDPFVGLDSLLTTPTEDPQLMAHASQATLGAADHRFAQPKKPLSNRSSAEHLPMDTNLLQPPTKQHHVHHSIDSLPSLSPHMASSFPFSPAGPFSNHSDTSSTHDQISPSDTRSEIATTSDDGQPSAFDFQVSITTPALTPDVGLDSTVDFLSPSSAPVAHTYGSPNGNPVQPNSAPSTSNGKTSSFPYDLLSGDNPSSSSLNPPPSNTSGHRHTRTVSQDRSRIRLGSSLGGVLEDANGEENGDDRSIERTMSSDHRFAQNGRGSELSTVSDRSDDSLADLLSNDKPNPPSNATSPSGNGHRNSGMSVDPELNAFFVKPRKTDLLDPSSANHLIPGSAALSSFQAKQRAGGFKTLPSGGINLHPTGAKADVFADLTLPTTSNSLGISSTGTKAQRSHTAADVEKFDPFFTHTPASSPTSHGHTQSLSIPMNQSNAQSAFTLNHIQQQQHQQQQQQLKDSHHVSKEDLEMRKAQRTKSEADQAEAAILQKLKF